MLYQCRTHDRQRFPRLSRLIQGQRPAGSLAFHVSGQCLEHLAEGQVGIADVGVGVAAPAQHDQIAVGMTGSPGEFLDQRRLAAAGLAHDQSHAPLTGQGLVEEAAQPGQLLLAGDKAGSMWSAGGRRLLTGRSRRDQRYRQRLGQPAVADLHVERLRFLLWFTAQLPDDLVAVGRIVAQGVIALPLLHQHDHQAPVCQIIPGVHLQELAGGSFRSFNLTEARMEGGQSVERPARLSLELLALDQRPLFERRAFAHGEPFQEGPAVQLHGSCEMLRCDAYGG